MSAPRKFRVWDPEAEEMHEPPHEFTLSGSGHLLYDAEGMSRPADGVPLFYTGLTDAEGAEIYESDVVEYDLKRGTQLQGGEVIFRAGSFMIERTDGIYVRLNKIVASSSHHLTVLGDTHETPDLLKEPA